MDDMQSALQSILSDPEQMQGIQSLAKQLMGDNPASDEKEVGGNLLNVLKNAVGGSGTSESENLMRAMMPYLHPGRKNKIERALKISKFVRIAQSVMERYGGELDGI